MTLTYEGMFLLDNQVVREDWKAAKRLVTDALEKHGAKVLTARRFDERKLAYPVKGKRRGTYLSVWFTHDGKDGAGLRREFDLSERVLRYLLLSSEGVPEEERALSEAENATDFVVPAPPPDDAVEADDDVILGAGNEVDELVESVPDGVAIDEEIAAEED